jgi:hypothetical protein
LDGLAVSLFPAINLNEDCACRLAIIMIVRNKSAKVSPLCKETRRPPKK